jgi:hypothetical protein
MVEPIYGEKPLGAGIIWPASGRNKDLQSVTGATAFQQTSALRRDALTRKLWLRPVSSF